MPDGISPKDALPEKESLIGAQPKEDGENEKRLRDRDRLRKLLERLASPERLSNGLDPWYLAGDNVIDRVDLNDAVYTFNLVTVRDRLRDIQAYYGIRDADLLSWRFRSDFTHSVAHQGDKLLDPGYSVSPRLRVVRDELLLTIAKGFALVGDSSAAFYYEGLGMAEEAARARQTFSPTGHSRTPTKEEKADFVQAVDLLLENLEEALDDVTYESSIKVLEQHALAQLDQLESTDSNSTS